MIVTKLRLELPNIAEVAVYRATQYVQTTTYIALYGTASLQSHWKAMTTAMRMAVGHLRTRKRMWSICHHLNLVLVL